MCGRYPACVFTRAFSPVTKSQSYDKRSVEKRTYGYLCTGHGACQTGEGAAAATRRLNRGTGADPSFHRSIVLSHCT